MTTEIGFCETCKIIRQDDEYGPVTPCACFVDHHAADCRLRIATRSPVGIACDDHRRDSCPQCFSCTCGVAPERMFVVGARVFTWEMDVGLVPAGTPPPPASSSEKEVAS